MDEFEPKQTGEETERLEGLERIDLAHNSAMFVFMFEGQSYSLTVKDMTSPDFAEWFSNYASNTPRCACCSRVIFPGEPVIGGHIEEGDSGLSHFSDECNNASKGYLGVFDHNGEIVPPGAVNS